ncbi:DUF2750 domain-containing protein [Brucellaceae bacterium C25G]
MKMRLKEIEAVMLLNSLGRYRYFIKKVADVEEVWGLYDQGWSISRTNDGMLVFPCWPAMEYALKCATNEWEAYHPKLIPLHDFINDFLPQAAFDGMSLGIFPNENGENIIANVEALISDIQLELENY